MGSNLLAHKAQISITRLSSSKDRCVDKLWQPMSNGRIVRIMDREAFLRQLAEAERLVRDGDKQIEREMQAVVDLERAGRHQERDKAAAQLETLLETQQANLVDLTHLCKKLDPAA